MTTEGIPKLKCLDCGKPLDEAKVAALMDGDDISCDCGSDFFTEDEDTLGEPAERHPL